MGHGKKAEGRQSSSAEPASNGTEAAWPMDSAACTRSASASRPQEPEGHPSNSSSTTRGAACRFVILCDCSHRPSPSSNRRTKASRLRTRVAGCRNEAGRVRLMRFMRAISGLKRPGSFSVAQGSVPQRVKRSMEPTGEPHAEGQRGRPRTRGPARSSVAASAPRLRD